MSNAAGDVLEMKSVLLPVFILAVVLPYASSSAANDKPLKATTPLSPDEVAIYKAVLRNYSGDNGDSKEASLNVSARTYPLDPKEGQGCLNGIENLSTASRSFHELSPDVLTGKGMKLVDGKKQARIVHSNDPSTTIRNGESVENAVKAAFSTALFSLSEIGFDKEHRFAVVSYRFWCGSLCGTGATLVFEKRKSEWRENRNCGGWIS